MARIFLTPYGRTIVTELVTNLRQELVWECTLLEGRTVVKRVQFSSKASMDAAERDEGWIELDPDSGQPIDDAAQRKLDELKREIALEQSRLSGTAS